MACQCPKCQAIRLEFTITATVYLADKRPDLPTNDIPRLIGRILELADMLATDPRSLDLSKIVTADQAIAMTEAPGQTVH